MAPSTVFSYWRRDHRRSSASPVSSSSVQPTQTSKGPGASNPPQLPAIPNTAALPTTFGRPSAVPDASSPQVSSENSPDLDLDKANVAISTTSINAPTSSSTNLAVPSSSLENQARPHSSPEECDRDPSLTSQSNYSQASITAPRLDHADSDSSKPNSPFRLSFGKGPLKSHTQSSESQLKRSSTPGVASSSHFRFKASPDDSPSDKTAAPKEYKFEGTTSRRQGDRDVSTENAHHKSGKKMLHLMNPMSLLARRRSSQITNLRAEEGKLGNRNLVPAIPDDYDPRIRGNIVHDFSAPRPRRNQSAAPVLLREATSRSSYDQPRHTPTHGNDLNVPPTEQKKRHSDYSPVFKEHFEDDQNVLQVENKAYLQSSLLTNPPNSTNDPHSMPVFARNLPSSLPDQDGRPGDHQAAPSQEPPMDNGPTEETPQDEDTIEFLPHQPLGLPKHLKSNASRFSFDMNGVESSTQEKLLEEKHKEKEAARRAKARLEGDFSDGEDDFDNELLDDLDGLEEGIPGVNVDADDGDDFDNFSGPGHILNKSWLAPGLSPVIASPTSPSAPNTAVAANYENHVPDSARERLQDLSDLSISAKDTENHPSPPQEDQEKPLGVIPSIPSGPPPGASQIIDDDDMYFDDGEFGDLTADAEGETFDESIFDDETSHLYDRKQKTQPTPAPVQQGGEQGKVDLKDDDDIYFDDGEFGDLTADAEGEKFDESIFDDETSHLYDRKQKSQPPAPVQQAGEEGNAGLKDALSANDGLGPEAEYSGGLRHMPSIASEYESGSRKYGNAPEGLSNLGSAKAHGGVLSEHNLEALHNALAKAAALPATDDRFERTLSLSDQSLGQESVTQISNSHPGLVSDDSHLSQPMDMLGYEEELDDFDFDDSDTALYDDPIIAAANAEALENDDEGFYGQEFGFYAQAHGGNNAELTHGGYFGSRGAEGITRSFSSRGKFQEPSLTPITEKSEWSTRNSVISLSAHHANNPMASPGLAQLVDMRDIEDDMTLSALIKLRRGAWGGSNGSLRSGSGSPPANPHSASNRASFTGLSDVSPTVHAAPPDLFGGTSATDSPPIKEYERPGMTLREC